MRPLCIISVCILLSMAASAGGWIGINNSNPVPARISVSSSSIELSTIHLSLDGFRLRPVETPRGSAYAVEVMKSTPILEAGAPDLPKMTVSLVIPGQAGMSVHVVSSRFKDYADVDVAPSKGVIMRQTGPGDVPYLFGIPYGNDRFYPGELTGMRDPYIIRNVRGQTVIIYPFQYNPVTRTLRVYYDLTLELYRSSEPGVNPLPAAAGDKKIPEGFLPVLKRQFANFSALSYTPLAEYGNLLVICHGPFMNAMQPYVDWKRSEGYHTEMVSKDSAGNSAAAIATFIANYYNSKGLTHLLLVGDAPQIPTNMGGNLGGPSDNAYGYIAGNDHYADVFVGRFSAETVAQVQTQVQRTLEYEQNPQFPAGNWFSTVIGIASDQGPGDDNEMDYEHVRNQQTKLLAYKYTVNPELFDGSQGGNDAPGNPTPAMVSSAVNSGASLILYTGHGSQTSWGTSGFSNSNVNQLTNTGKWPFIWSVACVNGDFTSGTCFAEAWLRASQGGQPTGAVAFLGSTINQSWDSPMEGQDAMTDILVESDSSNIKRTFAGLSINGCMEMIDAYGTDGANMADTWTIFGDPTIMVRTATPQPLVATYDTLLFAGDSILAVSCTTDGARVTATIGSTILATMLVANHTAVLAFPPLTTAYDTIRLVITAYNGVPCQGRLVVMPAPSPVVAGFTGIPLHVTPGHTVNFSDTSSGNTNNWQWSFQGGTPSFSTGKNPVVTYNDKGIYDVQLVAGNGFFADTLIRTGYITVDYPSSTGERTGVLTCTVLPNPGNGSFILDFGTSGTGEIEISVFDQSGKKVYHLNQLIRNTHERQSLSLEHLPDGVYFLKIKGDRNTVECIILITR